MFKKKPKAPIEPASLPNTPAVVHDQSVRLYAELFGDPAVHAARWFVVSVVELLVICLLLAVIWAMLPLQKIVPYVVESNETTGAITARSLDAAAYRPTTVMIRSEVNKWVEQMLSIDPYQTRDNLRKSTLLLRSKAVNEHTEWLRSEGQFKRLATTPTLVRTVQVNSIDSSKEGLIFVFATTTERTQGEPKEQRWRITIHYTIVPPTTEQELLANPAGLAITHFEIVPEIAR
jgi:type IV secretory pathway component VirB8